MTNLPGLIKEELQHYIRVALVPLHLHSKSAENLLLGTAAQESLMGRYVVQMGDGPARGIFQMEPITYDTILKYSDILRKRSIKLPKSVDMLVYDIRAAVIAARLKYSMIPKVLPDADDVAELAKYWKKYYNTELGRGTVEEFIRNYEKFMR